MSNSSSLLSISSIDSVIFFGSKKQEINPNFSFSPSVILLSTNSASIWFGDSSATPGRRVFKQDYKNGRLQFTSVTASIILTISS